jgi:hemolysin III
MEEFFNTISHGLGALLCVIGFFFLLNKTAVVNDPLHTTGNMVYIASFFCVYTVSMFYHLTRNPDTKRKMRIVDHSMIFLGIAGTYMPFLLSNMRYSGGYPVAITLAGICLAGIIFKLFFTGKFKFLSLLIYITMGGGIVFSKLFSPEFIQPSGLTLIKTGGVLYLLGTLFYSLKSLRYTHFVWHLFVLSGSICHFFAVYNYAQIR